MDIDPRLDAAFRNSEGDPLFKWLDSKHPVTRPFMEAVREPIEAMCANPVLGVIWKGMYPDPRSMVN